MIELWSARTAALGSRDDVAYVFVFENRGRMIGSTIEHPHSQVMAFGTIPPIPAAELSATTCHLCPDPPDDLLVTRSHGWQAAVPHAPSWPYELLISPRSHVADLPAAGPQLRAGLAAMLVDALTRTERLLGRDAPYMLWVHQCPNDGADRPGRSPPRCTWRPPCGHREYTGTWPAPSTAPASSSTRSIRGRPRPSGDPRDPARAARCRRRVRRKATAASRTAIWFAPGRVNLMGGPDYTEGFVLPFALGAGVTVAAARQTDRRIALVSRQQANRASPARHRRPRARIGARLGRLPGRSGLGAPPGGLPAGGADIAIDADLPAGAGLSSSAALECATALALTELHQVPVPRPELAALAQRAGERLRRRARRDHGPDRRAAVQAGHALLLDCRTGTGTPVPLDPAAAGLTLLVIDTRVPHVLGDGRYAERRRACERAASALGVRVAAGRRRRGHLAPLRDPSLRRVAGHVLAEHRRVLRAADLLRAGDQAAIGPLLTASHHSLRDRFEFSWPQADEAVAAALDAGAAGARMTGGVGRAARHRPRPAGRATQVRPRGHRAVRPPPLAGPGLPGRGALRRRPPPALTR